MSRCRYIVFALLMVSCASVHAETATYTVTSYHDISLSDGVAPDDSWVTFYSTTARGSQITAGNSATLTFGGFDGVRITSLSLQMHSNKSSGGGSLQVLLGETEIASIPSSSFADMAWHGAYANDWVDVTVPIQNYFTVGEGVLFTIVVEASANSLYVGGCSVTYHANSIQLFPMTVAFSTGTEEGISPVTESRAGKGVVLPTLQDADSVWFFLGWTESLVPHTEDCPKYYRAGEVYFPKKNMTLYALYTNKLGITPLTQDTLFRSGVYALVSADPYNCMMEGRIEEQKVGTCSASPYLGSDMLYHLPMETIPLENRYSIQFTDSTATIKHLSSNKYIGYSSSSHNLQTTESEWSVFHSAQHSVLFYHSPTADGLVYGLYPSRTRDVVYYSDTRLRVNESDRLLLFFAVPEEEPTAALYTTNPRSGLGLDVQEESQIRVTETEVLNPLGLSMTLYSLQGHPVTATNTNLSLQGLMPGLYILRTPQAGRIIRVR